MSQTNITLTEISGHECYTTVVGCPSTSHPSTHGICACRMPRLRSRPQSSGCLGPSRPPSVCSSIPRWILRRCALWAAMLAFHSSLPANHQGGFGDVKGPLIRDTGCCPRASCDDDKECWNPAPPDQATSTAGDFQQSGSSSEASPQEHFHRETSLDCSVTRRLSDVSAYGSK